MKDIIINLESIASLVDHASDVSKVHEAITSTKVLVQNSKKSTNKTEQVTLSQLEQELGVWQSKLSVILSDPAGRKGIAKHARFWAEKLRAVHVQ